MRAIWTVAAALACAAGCGPAPEKPAPAVEARTPAAIEVSGERALEEVRRFVELGPKEPGTPGAEKAAIYLRDRLRELGVEADIQEFRDMTPVGELTFRNVRGRIPGTGERVVLLGSHYDTKPGIEGFVGANDSGSSTGLLLELARALQANGPQPLGIEFAFFDGEESRQRYGPNDGFHGSRHWAEAMEADGTLSNLAAMILLDMVGDRDLTITIPRNGTPWLTALTFEAARAEGARDRFQLYPYTVSDDHEEFFARGVPAIDLIDFQFGSAPGKNDYWHTAQDTVDKLSAESLQIVGRVAARMVAEISRRAPEGK